MDSAKELRKNSPCPNSKDDYMDFTIRRVSLDGLTYWLKDSIFNETIAISLREKQCKIEIHNCEFKNGLLIRWDGKTEPKDYSIFLYKCEVHKACNLTSFDLKKKVAIDLSKIETLFLSGESERIDFFGSAIGKLDMESEKCDLMHIEKTKISQYKLNDLKVADFKTDEKKLAITDYSKFIPSSTQTISDVSEIYHKLVLQAVSSIEEKRKVNYELAKATSSKYLIPFGYFYHPLHVFYWMLGIITFFSILYWAVLGIAFDKAAYFSIYTFLTIGFGDVSESSSLFLKSILVFCEGFLGILYCSVFLASIINSSKK